MTFVNEPSPQDHSKFDKKLDAKSGSDGPSPWLIAGVIVAVFTILFILQNRNTVQTHFLFFDVRGKVWSSLFIAMLLGVLIDRLFSMWWRRRKEKKDEATT